jgi:hypothetical protein
MPAVSEFTKAKIVTLHQRGMSYGQISTNLGLSKGTYYPCQYAEVGTHWTVNYHRNLCLSMRNRLLLVVQQNGAMIKY